MLRTEARSESSTQDHCRVRFDLVPEKSFAYWRFSFARIQVVTAGREDDRLHGGAGRAYETMATPQSIVPTLQIMNGPMTGRLYQAGSRGDDHRPQPGLRYCLSTQVRFAQARGDRAEDRRLRDQGHGQHARNVRQRPKAGAAGLARRRQHAPDRRAPPQLHQPGGADRGRGRAVDGLRGDRRPEPERQHFPLVKPEAKFGPSADQPGAGRDARL